MLGTLLMLLVTRNFTPFASVTGRLAAVIPLAIMPAPPWFSGSGPTPPHPHQGALLLLGAAFDQVSGFGQSVITNRVCGRIAGPIALFGRYVVQKIPGVQRAISSDLAAAPRALAAFGHNIRRHPLLVISSSHRSLWTTGVALLTPLFWCWRGVMRSAVSCPLICVPVDQHHRRRCAGRC